MAARVPLPQSLSSAPFSVSSGTRAGLGLGRMRGPDLAKPFWGVRAPAHDDQLGSRCAAYLARSHSSAFFSHATAARLWEIPIPLRLQSDPLLDVGVPFPKRAPTAHGIRAHKLALRAGQLVELGGLPITTPIRTLLDIAPLLSSEDLLAAADSVIWWRRPLATLDELLAASAEFGGRGCRKLALVVPHVSDRADSAPESIIRWRMLSAGLPRFDVNVDIFDARGRFLAMADLSSHEYRMALDYEGDHHRTDKRQWQKDIARVPRLQDANWHHTRISAQDLRSSLELLARLKRLLVERGWRP